MEIKWTHERSARRFKLPLDKYISFIQQGLKRCQKCKKWKPFNDFPKDKSRYDGYHVKCFICQRINRPPRWHILTSAEKDRLRKRNKKYKWRKGVPLTEKHKQFLREKRIEEGQKGTGSFYGSNNPNWRGGITPINQILRNNSKYHQWRIAVFKRDNFTCQKCDDSRGGNLVPHHIKEWAKYPALRYKVNNGITLCIKCHGNIHKN